MSLEPADHDALTYSTQDVLALVEELHRLNLSTTWGDFTTRVKSLASEHGPEIAMAAVKLALRFAGVPV